VKRCSVDLLNLQRVVGVQERDSTGQRLSDDTVLDGSLEELTTEAQREVQIGGARLFLTLHPEDDLTTPRTDALVIAVEEHRCDDGLLGHIQRLVVGRGIAPLILNREHTILTFHEGLLVELLELSSSDCERVIHLRY
jgi:hypothetical protein